MRTLTLIVVLVALATTLTEAQDAKPAFEVASVRLNMSKEPGRDGPTIDSVAGAVELTLNAAVINETGLIGRWDYVISHNGLESGMKPARGGTPMEYPSIFKAVEEQLGLKLERRREKAPYDVLVMKSVELPSEN
jgi:Protein of unknown function (DUF3738)